MSALTPSEDNAALRSDVRRLGDLLGQSLARQDGEALLNLVELVRKSVREGNGEDLLKSISTADSVKLVRAFNVYFNLANVAEQFIALEFWHLIVVAVGHGSRAQFKTSLMLASQGKIFPIVIYGNG